MSLEPTEYANPYESSSPYGDLPSLPPPPPKAHHKRIIAATIFISILVTAGTGLASYNVGASSVHPATPTPIDVEATATAAYSSGYGIGESTGYGSGQGDAQATATAAYNQGSADDNASTLKWIHDKCTKDGNGNYTVFVKDGSLWCY